MLTEVLVAIVGLAEVALLVDEDVSDTLVEVTPLIKVGAAVDTVLEESRVGVGVVGFGGCALVVGLGLLPPVPVPVSVPVPAGGALPGRKVVVAATVNVA